MGALSLKPAKSFRFLGVKVTQTGGFLPWRDSFDNTLFGLRGRLVQAGLGDLATALSRAIQIKVLPSLLYGCEIWAVSWLWGVILGSESPYSHPRMSPVVKFL